MKKTTLCLSILMLMNPAFAATTPTDPSSAALTPPAPATTTSDTPSAAPSAPSTDTSTSAVTAPTPADAAPISAAPVDAGNIDCHYAIPPQTTNIDQNLVIHWAQKAIEQSFTFEYSQLNTQLENLKACFTDNGWQSFHDALDKSGNLKAIMNQQLQVSAMVDGESRLKENKKNEWKLMIPLQVVYQNKQQKLNQVLSVEVLVGRKASGDLGIMQVVAQPRKISPATPDADAATDSNTTTPESTPASPASAPAVTAPAPASPTPTTTAAPTDTPPSTSTAPDLRPAPSSSPNITISPTQ